MDKVIVITGPTGVGKTDISLSIAKMFNGEIINCDASQIRKNLNIGTAKIDLTKVDVKHHLIDFLEPNDDFSIKDYQVLARQKIKSLINNETLPFLVGGSGLYINSVIGDYDLEMKGRNQELELKYQDLSNEDLHNILVMVDADSANTIHYNNRRRVLRAIDLAQSGNKISTNKSGVKFLYDALIICLYCDRKILYERINKRVEIMLNSGWIEEVKDLKLQEVDFTKIKDIGYSEINQYLEKQLTLEDAQDIIKQKTRNYAKRQMTWFKNKMNCHFIEMDYNDIGRPMQEIADLITIFLNKS